MKEVKGQAIMWKKILAKYVTIKSLLFRIYKDLIGTNKTMYTVEN